MRRTGILIASWLVFAGAAAFAQNGDILPRTGAVALAGNCTLTLDGAVFGRCECRMLVSAAGGQYLMSGLNVGCQGRAAQAGSLGGQIGETGRTIQVLYEQGPTTEGGSGMWLTSDSATIDHVLADEDWLLLTLRLAGQTRFENSRGKACVDGATGARC